MLQDKYHDLVPKHKTDGEDILKYFQRGGRCYNLNEQHLSELPAQLGLVDSELAEDTSEPSTQSSSQAVANVIMFDNILECDLEEEQLSSSLDEEQLSCDLDDGDESDDSTTALLYTDH